ncbi:hypothetical protein [Euzebya sp.]|uniref:hypothetical protein n=1 Tax=Euzebya sp. TaxID=1971409 RepID=UPI00351851B1
MTATTTHPSGTRAVIDTDPMARALTLDAIVSGAAGVALLAGSGLLAEPLGISTPWLIGLGAFMALYAVDLRLLATRLPRLWGIARLIPPGNAGWVLASLAAVALRAWELTGLGTAVVLGQAAIVAVLVVVQARAVRAAA